MSRSNHKHRHDLRNILITLFLKHKETNLELLQFLKHQIY